MASPTFRMLGCVLFVFLATANARGVYKRSTSCPDEFNELSASHTRCLDDVGEVVTLTQAEIQAAVDEHNRIRGEVVPPASDMNVVTWDEDMAEVAAKWAAQCIMEHDEYVDRSMPGMPGVRIGQNVAAGNQGLVGAIQMWASEISDFSYNNNPAGVVGHYTQIVFAPTVRVGCGIAVCPNSKYKKFQVCNYASGQTTSALKKPYTMSLDSCSRCQSSCDSSGKLCDCGGKMCLNGGVVDLTTCTCTCPGIYSGDLCETVECIPDPSYCPLYKEFYGDDVCTKFTNVPTECPNMCGVC